jgi:hypothetical protein
MKKSDLEVELAISERNHDKALEEIYELKARITSFEQSYADLMRKNRKLALANDILLDRLVVETQTKEYL